MFRYFFSSSFRLVLRVLFIWLTHMFSHRVATDTESFLTSTILSSG